MADMKALHLKAYLAVAEYGKALSATGTQPPGDLQTCYAMLSFLDNFRNNAAKNLALKEASETQQFLPPPRQLAGKRKRTYR